jgi:hypothetical protein
MLGEEKPTCLNSLKSVNKSLGLLSCDHIAYVGSEQFIDCWIYELILNEGNLTCICDGSGPSFTSGATCITNNKILVTRYSNGILYEIDLENCELTTIGGGGVGLNGLAYDPYNEVLYGCSSNAFYKIDPEDGSQEYIGSFGISDAMIAIASDENSTLYGWDVKFSGESNLYKINTETGEATIVGGMGKTLCYAQDGDFCKEDDILYLAAYITSPEYGSYLCTCDKQTGELTILGQIQDNAQITIFAIPWNSLPYAPIIFQENESLYVYTTDPDGDYITYTIDWGDGTINKTGYYPSGHKVEINHEWSEPGVYNITAKAKDEHGAESDWSDPYIIVVGNYPPDTPIINGPTSGKAGVEYYYTFNTTDPEEDPVMYLVDWGNNDTDWTEYGDSEVEITLKHTWNDEGIYTIKAKAIDINGAESEWGTLSVTMPRNKEISNVLLLRFLERLPILQKMLLYLIK